MGPFGRVRIDGVISLDRLGLELDHPPKPSAKADKRLYYSSSVGRPANSNIRRSLVRRRTSNLLAGQRAVFLIIRRSLRRRRIGVSAFTQQAVEFVQSVERIVLIDGARLTGLMIEHGVGVGHRVVKVLKEEGDGFVE